MEKSKRKIITLASLFLCCLAIVGVGFAAWVITGEDTEETKGSITVDTVSDERFVIEVLDSYIKETKEAVDTTVVLGGPETTPADAWITYNGEKEDLDAVIVVKVKNYDKQNCEVTAAITDKTKYEYLVTAGYLADATPVVTLIGTESDTEGVNYGIYSITLSRCCICCDSQASSFSHMGQLPVAQVVCVQGVGVYSMLLALAVIVRIRFSTLHIVFPARLSLRGCLTILVL